MTAIMWYGARPRISSRLLTAEDRLCSAGRNTGNLFIGHALKRHLKYDRIIPSESTCDDASPIRVTPQYINEQCDLIALPASNWLSSAADLGGVYRFLEQTDRPMLVAGLGAQAETMNEPPTLSKDTINLLRLFSERCKVIGVRGEFTAEVLEQHGVHNYQIIGCPAYYWCCNPNLRICKKPFRSDFKIAYSRNVWNGYTRDKEQLYRVERGLITLAFQRGEDTILQGEPLEVIFTNGYPGELDADAEQQLMQRYAYLGNKEQVVSFLRKHFRVYFDITEWAEQMPFYDFAIGTRLHGTLMAIQQGVPAVMLTHDARTEELFRFFQLPHHDISKFTDLDLQQLYTEADFTTFESSYPAKFNRYIDFLEANGAAHTLTRAASCI